MATATARSRSLAGERGYEARGWMRATSDRAAAITSPVRDRRESEAALAVGTLGARLVPCLLEVDLELGAVREPGHRVAMDELVDA